MQTFKHYYCSTFSQEYAYKELLLYNSIEKHDPDFVFFMICLHDEAIQLFKKMNLKHAAIISLEDIENDDKELLAVKNSRNVKEYIWTSKGSVCLYLFKHYAEIDHIVWLDGDTFFFSNPDPIFTEWGEYSIVLTSEKWLEEHKELGVANGFYNTGFMGFKRDEYALESLHWFRERLIEWCFDKWENGLWSDQVYVNDWLTRFQNVGIIENMGVNLTPYIINYALKEGAVAKDNNNNILINNEKLVYFHFYGFKYYDGNVFDICHYVMNNRDPVIQHIYIPYINAINAMMVQIKEIDSSNQQERDPKDYHLRNYFNIAAHQSADQNHLCTIISSDQHGKGLALYQSLQKQLPNFKLWICCMDEQTFSLFHAMGLENVILIPLKNLEGQELLSIKDSRKPEEYSKTLKASFISYILKNHYNMESIVYMDPEMYLFSKAIKLFDKLKQGHSLVMFRRNSFSDEDEKVYGVYHAGIIGFKRDEISMECLFKWKKKCIDWCFNKAEKGRWAEQKYLDKWPRRYQKVKIMEIPYEN